MSGKKSVGLTKVLLHACEPTRGSQWVFSTATPTRTDAKASKVNRERDSQSSRLWRVDASGTIRKMHVTFPPIGYK